MNALDKAWWLEKLFGQNFGCCRDDYKKERLLDEYVETVVRLRLDEIDEN